MSGHMQTRAFLGLGGNLGDPASTMAHALRVLDARSDMAVERVSSLYRTPPWGKLDQPDFLNAVAEVRTSLSARELLDVCLSVEKTLKRERRERWGPRLIDIDLLLYGQERVHDDVLEIPHPRMAQRAFVLVPLLEIAPEIEIDGKSIAEKLAALGSEGIEKITADGFWWRG